MFPINAGFNHPVDGLKEVVAVGLNVKSDEVRTKKTIHQLALPRADAESLRVWPRYMPEDRHAGIGSFLFDQPRQQGKVIILYEHNRLGNIFDLFENSSGEFFVHFLVTLPVL